jgi:hypothetical protein
MCGGLPDISGWLLITHHASLNVFLLFPHHSRDLTDSARPRLLRGGTVGELLRPGTRASLGWYSVYGHALAANLHT